MIQPNEYLSESGVSRRVLAVVASDKAKAGEIVRCFADAGDAVETEWYADLGQLRERAGGRLGEFDAVVLFEAKSEAEATELRAWLGNTPLFEAA